MTGGSPAHDLAADRRIPVHAITFFIELRDSEGFHQRLFAQAKRFTDLQRRLEDRLTIFAYRLEVIEVATAQ